MTTHSNNSARSASKWPVAVLCLLLLLALVPAGVWAWRRFDPFHTARPAIREAMALADASRRRPLNDMEFDSAVLLLNAEEPSARLASLAILEQEAGRSAERRRQAVTALTGIDASIDPGFGKVVTQALARIRAAGPEQ